METRIGGVVIKNDPVSGWIVTTRKGAILARIYSSALDALTFAEIVTDRYDVHGNDA